MWRLLLGHGVPGIGGGVLLKCVTLFQKDTCFQMLIVSKMRDMTLSYSSCLSPRVDLNSWVIECNTQSYGLWMKGKKNLVISAMRTEVWDVTPRIAFPALFCPAVNDTSYWNKYRTLAYICKCLLFSLAISTLPFFFQWRTQKSSWTIWHYRRWKLP